MAQIDHSRNLIIKTLAVGILIYLALPLVGQVPATDRWVIALVTAVIGYLVGDLILLPRWGSTWAAIADIAVIGLTVWIVAGLLTTTTITLGGALLIGVLSAIVEWFFHLFLKQTPPNPAGNQDSGSQNRQ